MKSFHRFPSLILFLFLASAAWSGTVVELTTGDRLNTSFSYHDGRINIDGHTPLVATEVRKILFNVASSTTGQTNASDAATASGTLLPLELASQAAAFRAKYPDAGGITLRDDNHWTYHADGTWTVRVHTIEWIMKEDHLQYAGLTLGFTEGRDRIKIIRARCVHADGTVFDADLSKIKITKPQTSPGMFIAYMILSVHIPQVELGSFVETEVETEFYNPYHREFFFPVNFFQSSDPVFSSRLIVDLPQERKLFWEARNMPKDKDAPVESTVGNMHRYAWESAEVVPHVAEPQQPRSADALPYVQAALFEGWDKVYDWINGYWKTNTTPSPELASTAQSLVAGLTDEDAKIAKIFHWIQKNIRYIIIKGDAATMYGSYPAHETVKKQFGCCVDKAMVLSAMLNAIGVKNGPLLINVMSHDMSPRIANLSITHSISRVTRANGQKFYLDSTSYNFRYPSLPTCDQGRYCLDPFDRSFDTIPLQKPEMNQHHLVSSLTLALDGTLTVTSNKDYTGETEAGSRASMKSMKPAEREKMLSNRINSYGQGGSLTSFEVKNLEDIELPFTYTFSYRIPSYTREIADLAVFKMPGLMDSVEFPETALASRTYPIEYDALTMDFQEGTMYLAPEYRIRSLPEPVTLNTPYFTFSGRYDRDGEHAIKYSTVFQRTAKRVPLNEYPKFKTALDQIKRFGRERIFLTRPMPEGLTQGVKR
ncbi:MAG: DUF3857 and transglutaminase domain-containing protein [Candidatus Riflebacteria bacterium]|nr:DUF3857 and transglutaminase domain-containing protein [Candidatus Riflebacteria bacterium]